MSNTGRIGHACLFILVFQNLMYTLCMRYVRSRPMDLFVPSSMIIVSETVKLITCIIILILLKQVETSYLLIRRNLMDSLKTCVPALIYLIQNRLLVAALSNLDAATYQVAYQLKLLTTAVFSVIILRKPLSRMQWISMILLFFGVAIVEPPNSGKNANPMSISQNFPLGLFYVICASFLSGFACIYFELLLKKSSKSLWLRNIELAGASLIIGIVMQWFTEWDVIESKGFFYGFDGFVWLAVALHSFGGLMVAMVVKYANNMLKGFACSVSIVLSCLFSVVFLNIQLSPSFLLGSCFVLIAVVLYSAYPPKVEIKSV